MATRETARPGVPRLVRAHDLPAPSQRGGPRGPRSHDRPTMPATVDSLRGTGPTTAITSGRQVAVFIAVGHRPAERVGVQAASRATRFETLEPIRHGVRCHFGGFAEVSLAASRFATTTPAGPWPTTSIRISAPPGIGRSPAFVRAPEGNVCQARR